MKKSTAITLSAIGVLLGLAAPCPSVVASAVAAPAGGSAPYATGSTATGSTAAGSTATGNTAAGGTSAVGDVPEAKSAKYATGIDTAVSSVASAEVPLGVPVELYIDITSASSDCTPPLARSISVPGWDVCEAECLNCASHGAQLHWRYRLTVLNWELGTQMIPPVEIGGLSTSPLTVNITRPEGTSVALQAAPPWDAWRERLGGDWAGLGALAGALLVGGAVWCVVRYRNKPEREVPRRVRVALSRARDMNEEGWALAETAVRDYLTWKLASAGQELTLQELAERATSVDSAWAELLRELELRKYHADGAGPELQPWLERALGLVQT